MKTIIFFSILFCTLALPVFGELTPQDLDKIRLIVKEEIKPLKADIVALKVDVARLDGRLTGVEKQIATITNLICWLIALIVIAIGIPQIIMAFRSRKGSRPRAKNRRAHKRNRNTEATAYCKLLMNTIFAHAREVLFGEVPVPRRFPTRQRSAVSARSLCLAVFRHAREVLFGEVPVPRRFPTRQRSAVRRGPCASPFSITHGRRSFMKINK